MILATYTPRDWYWIIGSDESRAWSSAAGSYVTEYPPDRVTRIGTELELYDVLANQKLASKAPQGPFTLQAVRDVLLLIDAAAVGEAATEEDLRAVAEQIEFNLPTVIG